MATVHVTGTGIHMQTDEGWLCLSWSSVVAMLNSHGLTICTHAPLVFDMVIDVNPATEVK